MANFNNGFAQKKVFSTGDDVLKTSIGDTIIIASDSAYVLSGGRAEYLNNRLNELDTIKLLYLSQSLHRDELINKINELDALLNQLKDEMVKDSLQIRSSLDIVINDLSKLSEDLKKNNDALGQNNDALKEHIERLNSVIKDLKKELRWIWWNGLSDKIFAFAIGIGTCLLIATLIN